MKKIGFLASHNGSAAKAIVMACQSNVLSGQPVLLISNNQNCGAIDWANALGLDTFVVNNSTSIDADQKIAEILKKNDIDIVVCSGYMKLIGPKTIQAMDGKILNIHPALLPLYGGKGMYGRHVHQAVFDNKNTQTGATIHLVDNEYDRGRIIAQKIIPVLPTETVDDIEQKVKAAEPDFYIETLRPILNGDISLL
jgi:phosphoribosylglycinamide formyltransferase 1